MRQVQERGQQELAPEFDQPRRLRRLHVTEPAHISIERLAYALRARARDVPPNRHQQPMIATSSNLRT